MPWLQLKIQTLQARAEQLADILTGLGALSVTFQDAADQPLFEPPPGETPLWTDTLVTGLFDSSAPMQSIIEILGAMPELSATDMRTEILEDKDWVREWMDNYHPMRFGQHLWVVPSHHPPPEPDAVNILLDPGLAFGTGTHPTTALCLEWLDSHDVRGQVVIDYGCGSGILGIAAARLGAASVLAIDNDPQALISTRRNAEQNAVSDRIICQGIHEPVSSTCDVLLANILATPLTELADRFADLCRPGALLVLSGILASQSAALLAIYEQWFEMDQPSQREDWVRLSGQRRRDN